MNTLLDTAELWLRNTATLSWKGALLALAIGLALLLLRRHISPAWRHGLWLLVILRFTVPDIGSSSVSLARVAEVPNQLSRERVVLPERISLPAEQVETAPAVEMEPRAEESQVVAPPPFVVRWTLAQKLTSVWLLGVAAVLGVMLLLHLRLLRRLHRDKAEPALETAAVFREACHLAHVRWAPRLIITDAVAAPSLFGILRPAILLPRQVAMESDATSLKLILLHELAHLRRCDLWAQLVASCVIALHWFNPLVWIAARRLRTEAEMAADAHALHRTDAREAHRFGELLLSFANRAAAGWMLALTSATLLGICENKHDLRRRIEALMDIAKGRRTRWLLGLVVFLTAVLVGLTNAPAEEAKKPTPQVPKKKNLEVTVSGTITSKADGKPVKDAVVRVGLDFGLKVGGVPSIPLFTSISRGTAKTDDSGHYSVTASALGTRVKSILMVDAPGMAVVTAAFSSEGKDVKMDHALEPDAGITGAVVNAEGKPVFQASVSFESRLTLLDSSAKISSGDFHRSLGGYWIGRAETDQKGVFSGKVFDRAAADQFWLVIHHPTQGFQRVRYQDLKPGGAIHLAPWSILQGKLLDPDGQPIRGAELKFHRSEYEKDAAGKITLSVSKSVTCKTDALGHYRVDQILPGLGSSYVSLNGNSLSMNLSPHQAGETQELNLRQPAVVPDGDKRDVTGRIVVPAGYRVRSDKHQIQVDMRIVGNVEVHRLNEPDDEGRFWARPQPPGDYILRIWVQPKDRKLAYSYERGLSMPFKLELGGDNAALQLGEFKLEAADFVFKPAKPTALTESRDQLLDASVAGAATFATWGGSGGSGLGKESPLTAEGRIVGSSAASSQQRFMIRATKPDGTRHYSPLLQAIEDTAFVDELTLTPGVAVEGQMRGLPSDYQGGGWAVAAVRVEQKLEPGIPSQGGVPFMLWHAWTPVQKDGRFHFKSLPRGSLTLVGFGDGWITRNSGNSSPEVRANLMGPETLIQLSADTKPSFQKRVQLLHPDGSPAAGATISVSSISSTHLNRAWSRAGHATESEDAEAYARYKQQPIPGHSVTADAEGYATLSNQLYQSYFSNKTTCEVKWTDPKTKAAHVEKLDIQIGSKETQVVKLTGKTSP